MSDKDTKQEAQRSDGVVQMTAAEMGRKGGSRKVKKGFASLSVEERRKIQAAGVEARRVQREREKYFKEKEK